MILQAILTFFFRILSGVINKFGYQKNDAETFSLSFVAIFFTLICVLYFKITFISTLLAAGAMLSILFKFGAFVLPTELKRFKWQSDIHLWELMMTSLFSLQMVAQGADLVTMCLVMYPSLFIHKAVINSAFGQGVMWSVTDDATGATYNLPYLAIKIPRFNQEIRLYLAIFSIVLFVENLVWLHWHFTIYQVVKFVQSYV